MAHANEIRLGSFFKAALGIVVIYVAGTYGGEAPICAEGVTRCGATPFWNFSLIASGGIVLIFSIASMMHALTLEKNWSKLAVTTGGFAAPAVMLTLVALGVFAATANGL